MNISKHCYISTSYTRALLHEHDEIDEATVQSYLDEDRLMDGWAMNNRRLLFDYDGGIISVFIGQGNMLTYDRCYLLFDTADDKNIFYKNMIKAKLKS